MNLEGRKIQVNKSVKELSEMLNNAEQYKEMMSDKLQKFEVTEDGFRFGLKGMPEIGLKLEDDSQNGKIVLKSDNSNLDFSLTGNLRPLEVSKTEVQILFEGNFNPFIKMMVQKPLQNFIDMLTDKIEKL